MLTVDLGAPRVGVRVFCRLLIAVAACLATTGFASPVPALVPGYDVGGVYDAPSFVYDVVANDAQVAIPYRSGSLRDEVPSALGAQGSANPVEHIYDSSFNSVAPRSTRVYSSGADAFEGGAVSLDDAARIASENGIDMRANSLQYEGGAPPNLYGFTSMDGAGNIVRAPDGRYIVTLTDAGLSSPGSALNTIAHELNHIREISRTPGFHIPEEAGATLAGDLAERFMRGG